MNREKFTVSSDFLRKFLKNPSKYEMSEEEYEEWEEGMKPSYKFDSSLEFDIRFYHYDEEVAIVSLTAIFYGESFIITDFVSHTEGKGFGTKAIKLLHDKLQEKGITLSVTDITDEAKGFWDKMYNLGYIE